MDETTTQGSDPSAWFSATLGTAIGTYVDRTLNREMQIPPTTGYGMDQYGNLYQIGQPAPAPVTVGVKNNNMLLLLILGAFAFMEFKK